MPTCGEVDVQPAFDNANVTITDCPAPGSANPGDTVDVDVTIENTNDVDANVSAIEVTVGSNQDTVFDVIIPANSTETFTLSPTVPSSTGTYTVEAQLTNVGTATATATASARAVPGNVARDASTGTLATLGAGIGAAGLRVLADRR